MNDENTPTPGVCQVCRCTEDDACIDYELDPDSWQDAVCDWANDDRTLCTFCAAAAGGASNLQPPPSSKPA